MTLRLYLRSTVLATALLAMCPGSADVLCDADHAFHRSGISTHKQCLSDAVPQFADYASLLSQCVLKIYVTDRSGHEMLESGLLSAYRRHVETLPWCDGLRRPAIEFKRARYGYHQLSAWKAALESELQKMKPGSAKNIALCDAKLHVTAADGAGRNDYSGALRKLGIPRDAYMLGPDALDSYGPPTIGLPSPYEDKGDQLSLPLKSGTGGAGAKLIIGRTSLSDTLRMLPPCPGHVSPEALLNASPAASPFAGSEESSGTDNQIVYAYIPAQSSMRLSFDERARLIALAHNVEVNQKGLEELIEGLSEVIPLQRVYADDRIVLMVGEVRSVFVTLGAERDWYDKPYRVGISYAHDPGTEGSE